MNALIKGLVLAQENPIVMSSIRLAKSEGQPIIVDKQFVFHCYVHVCQFSAVVITPFNIQLHSQLHHSGSSSTVTGRGRQDPGVDHILLPSNQDVYTRPSCVVVCQPSNL